MEDCIFCKIVKKEIPSYPVYEDDDFMAFMDVFPRVKGHVLVIPKEHYRWVYDVPEFTKFWEVAKRVGLKVQEIVNAKFVSFVTVGEAVPHAHIHILPQKGGEIEGISFKSVIQMSHEEIGELAGKILID